MSGTNDNTGSAYTFFAVSDLTPKVTTWDPTKGLIHSRVSNWDGTCNSTDPSGCVAGAIVTATSKLHPDAAVPYTILYTSGSSTTSDGKFYILNVDEGDYVAVSASSPGWGFQTRTYVTHANSVSENQVKGTALPVVAANASNSGTGPLATLTATETSGTFSGSIKYTNDLSDPTSSPTVHSFFESSPSSPLVLPLSSGNTTLKYYACNSHNICGNVGTSSYSVYSVAANESGTGSGTLSSSTTGVSCSSGTSCSGNLLGGTSAVITAAAAPGSTLSSWSGCTSVSGNQCNLTVSSNSTVTATFTPSVQNLLTTYAQGAGSGSVSSNPGGISYSYPAANTGSATLASAALTANANTGSTATWSGSCDSTTGNGSATATCSISSMNVPKTATATFSPLSCGNEIVSIAGTSYYYDTIHEAFFGVNADGQSIRMQAVDITESPNYAGSNSINLQGGFDCNYGSNSGFTTIHGIMTFGGGSVTVENVIVQ